MSLTVILEQGTGPADPFVIKQGATSPAIDITLAPVTLDLTGATVRFSMKHRGTGAVAVNRAPALIVTVLPPVVRYVWDAADTAVPGLYDAEVEATLPGGAVEILPGDGFIPVRVFPRV